MPLDRNSPALWARWGVVDNNVEETYRSWLFISWLVATSRKTTKSCFAAVSRSGASDSQTSNALAPFHKDQACITMVVGRARFLGTASKTSAFGLESFHKDQARMTMVVGCVGILRYLNTRVHDAVSKRRCEECIRSSTQQLIGALS